MSDLSRPWPFDPSIRGGALFALGFIALFAIAYVVDVPLSLWAQGWPEPLRAIFRTITDLGLSEFYLVPALVLFLLSALLSLVIERQVPRLALRQMAGIWAFVFAGIGLPGLVAALAKRVVGRGRPEVFADFGPYSFEVFINDWTYQSFPSGHATTAFAACFTFAFLARRWFPLLLAGAMLVAFSRVVVGAHYPTDIVGGALVGTLGAHFVRNVFAARSWVFRRLPDGRIALREPSAVRRLLQRR